MMESTNEVLLIIAEMCQNYMTNQGDENEDEPTSES